MEMRRSPIFEGTESSPSKPFCFDKPNAVSRCPNRSLRTGRDVRLGRSTSTKDSFPLLDPTQCRFYV